MVGILVSDQRETSWKWLWPNRVLYRHLAGGTDKNQHQPQEWQLVSQSQVYERYRNLVAQRLPEMITVVELIICSSIQGTRSCVTVLTTPRHWTLFLVIYLQSTTPPSPHFFRWSNYTPSCTYRLYRNRHFPFPFAGQIFYAFLFTPQVLHVPPIRPNNLAPELNLWRRN